MRAALFLALLAAPASAACQADAVFSCTIGQKTLQVCHWKGALIYGFGRDGRPELTIAEPLETVAFTPWPGIGRAIWDSLAFSNDGITYEVTTSVDRMDEAAQLEGGVNVIEGEAHLASLACDPGTPSQSLDVIYELKSEIGQCWDFDAKAWTRSCG